MSDLICKNTMRACNTPGICSPHGGCRPAAGQLVHPDEHNKLREDYAALEAECERLADELDRKSVITGDYIARCQRLADERDALAAELDRLLEGRVLDAETISTLEQELKQSRDAYQNIIDQTTPLEPVPGDPRWSKRIELDEVIAERDQLRAELAAIKSEAEQ